METKRNHETGQHRTDLAQLFWPLMGSYSSFSFQPISVVDIVLAAHSSVCYPIWCVCVRVSVCTHRSL